MVDGADLFYAVPTGGNPTPSILISTARLFAMWPDVEFGTMNSSRLVANRNRLCEMFLQSGRKYMMMVDDDMLFEATMVADALEVMEETDTKIIGGLAFGDDGGQLFSTLMVKAPKGGGYIKGGSWPDRALQPVDVTGAALIIARRDLILDMQKRYKKRAPYWWFEEEPRGDHAAGEDVVFWERVKFMGVQPMVYTGLKTGHEKPRIITHHTYDHQLKDKAILLGPLAWWVASVFNRLKVPVRPPEDRTLDRWRIVVPHDGEIDGDELKMPREWIGATFIDTGNLVKGVDPVMFIRDALRVIGVAREPDGIKAIVGDGIPSVG